LCFFHHPASLTLSIVSPRPRRSHITLTTPERYDRPAGPSAAPWDAPGPKSRTAHGVRRRTARGIEKPTFGPGEPFPTTVDSDVGQSRRALIGASSMLARATMRMILAAQSAYASGRRRRVVCNRGETVPNCPSRSPIKQGARDSASGGFPVVLVPRECLPRAHPEDSLRHPGAPKYAAKTTHWSGPGVV
jgi:hypothetical protein